MRLLLGTFKVLIKMFIFIAAIAGLAYAYDSYGKNYNKYVVFEQEVRR